MLLKTDRRKFSHRKEASPSAKASQEAWAICRWKRISKISSIQQWFNFSLRVVWLITTPDDNKLDDFTSILKADLFGKCLWGPTERIIKRRKIVINKRKRTHFLQLRDSKASGGGKQLFVKISQQKFISEAVLTKLIFYFLGSKLKSSHSTTIQRIKTLHSWENHF